MKMAERKIRLRHNPRGWLPLMGVELPEEQIIHILDEAEQVLRPYVTSDGKVAFETSAHIVTGKKG
jgi:hypothetical protein